MVNSLSKNTVTHDNPIVAYVGYTYISDVNYM